MISRSLTRRNLAKALAAAGFTMRLAARVKAPFKPVADQLIRSARACEASDIHLKAGLPPVLAERLLVGY